MLLHCSLFVIVFLKMQGAFSTNEHEVNILEDPIVENGLYIFNEKNFNHHISSGDYFIKFFAPWCGHCKKLSPVWADLAESIDNDQNVKIGKLDCTISKSICEDRGIKGYPTLIYYRNGKVLEKYTKGRDLKSLKDFVKSKTKNSSPTQLKDDDQPSAASKPNAADSSPNQIKDDQPSEGSKTNSADSSPNQIKDDQTASKMEVELDENGIYNLNDLTFHDQISDGDYFIKFFAPWCGHCKQLAPVWTDLAKSLENDKTVNIAKVDCTQAKSVCQQRGIVGYPTLIYSRNGKIFTRYEKGRDLRSLLDFVKSKTGNPSPTQLKEDNQPSAASKQNAADKEHQKPKAAVDNTNNAKAGQNEVVPDNGLYELTERTFKKHISKGDHFIKFYAPWCGFCKNLAPTWTELAKSFEDHKTVKIGKFDCTTARHVCTKLGINGLPTLFYFRNGEKLKTSHDKKLNKLQDFVKVMTGEKEPEPEPEPRRPPAGATPPDMQGKFPDGFPPPSPPPSGKGQPPPGNIPKSPEMPPSGRVPHAPPEMPGKFTPPPEMPPGQAPPGKSPPLPSKPNKVRPTPPDEL